VADYVANHTTLDSLDLDILFKAAGQVETALGIAAETLFEPKPGTRPKTRRGPRPPPPEIPDLFA